MTSPDLTCDVIDRGAEGGDAQSGELESGGAEVRAGLHRSTGHSRPVQHQHLPVQICAIDKRQRR